MTSERRTRKRDKNRQALLDAALALFAEQGIYAPAIEEITQRADLGKGTFYQYFSSREDLIAQLVRRGFEELIRWVDDRLAAPGEWDDRLTVVLDAHAQFFERNPAYLVLLHQARGWMKLPQGTQSPIRGEFDRYVGRMQEFIPKSLGKTAVPPEGRRRMGLVLSGFISGVLSFEYILGGGLEAFSDLPADAALLAALLGA